MVEPASPGATVERRLAAILAADVVGYSRLVGEDEAGTIARLKTLRLTLIEPLIAEHRGRIVKLMGDGALCEFASVVEAVACAVAVQRAIARAEPDEPEVRRIRFRIGINLGDIIIEDGDIYGDGVNIAARLEQLAEPGGICVSEKVRAEIGKKLDYGFVSAGRQRVKNIVEPIDTWRVVMDGRAPVLRRAWWRLRRLRRAARRRLSCWRCSPLGPADGCGGPPQRSCRRRRSPTAFPWRSCRSTTCRATSGSAGSATAWSPTSPRSSGPSGTTDHSRTCSPCRRS